MTGPRRIWAGAVILTGSALGLDLGLTRCTPRLIDAVDVPDSSAPDAVATVAIDAAVSFNTWPNGVSRTNSDRWISDHHDQIVEMHPHLVVLDFYDGLGTTPVPVAQIRTLAQSRIDAISEGSRYHGYSGTSPDAPRFLLYDLPLQNTIDLTDAVIDPNWNHASSKQLPVDGSGAFDTGKLFTQEFASNYGYTDETNPSRYLTLCELFEQGKINELWLAVGDPSRLPPLFAESKRRYDADNHLVPGFECTGYACFPQVNVDAGATPIPQCGVTIRIGHLDPNVAVGCDLIVRSIGIENMRFAIPYLQANALTFINQDFDTRLHAPFGGWEAVCAERRSCITYPTPTSAEATYADGGVWQISPFVQGCGTAHFPANATAKWDYANTQPVPSTCEHYAMHDGPDGSDRLSDYRADLPAITGYAQQYMETDAGAMGGCGTGWQIYYRQSMPGLNNLAIAADGTPMKNWWPFLFY